MISTSTEKFLAVLCVHGLNSQPTEKLLCMLQFNEVSTPMKYSFVISFARILLKRLKRNPTSSSPMVNFELEKKRGQLK
jgi:hypothetical protein